jgi:Tfp pilus assembly protein PilX
MHTRLVGSEKGSVLIIALMTITIVTLICATSLYIASQNTNTGMQTAGWQQALTGAESGIDAAVRALNGYVSPAPSVSPAAAWNNWYTVNTALPTPSPGVNVAGVTYEPTGTATPATSPPADANHYIYLPSSKLSVSFPNSGGEGAAQVKTWVTIDTAGMTKAQDANGKQWYRVRSTAQTIYPSGSALLKRVSNNRLDNDLRNSLMLQFNRDGGSSLGPTRTIEVVLKPLVATASGGPPFFLQNALQMSGGGTIDHFSSLITSAATFLTSPSTYRSTYYNETLVGMLNANGSDLKSTYVYGEVAYSTTGAAPKNTTNIQGTPKLTTPFTATVPTVTDPAGAPDVTYAGGSPPFTTIAAGTKAHPKLVKVNGNLTVPGGQSLTITAPNSGADNNYITIWVTGDYTTSGSGFISQAAGAHVTWYVDGNMTTSGQSYNNADGQASETSFYLTGNNTNNDKFTISGSGNFVGTITAPGYDGTISGSGSLVGSLIASTLTISGGASMHYDDALDTATGVDLTKTGNYAFASWFEDNSNPTHKDSKQNYVVY